MAISQSQMTLEEFLKLPEEEPPLEFEDGKVTQKVSPKAKHSVVELELANLINGLAGPKRVARAFVELRASFSGQSHVPDVAVYRWERIPVDASGEVADDFFEPPDIAVEIISPDQSVMKLIRLCLWFVANGVKVALLVDPEDKSILIFRPGHVLQVFHGEGSIDLADVIEGLDLKTDDIFGALKMG